jgi:hydrogenase expression/formation protein HypE
LVDSNEILAPGKLPGDLLAVLLKKYVRDDPSVIVGPGVGRDAAAIEVGDRILVVKTDPITFATQDAGRYLVNVNANDITCMGAAPRWLLVTSLLPAGSTTPELVESLFSSLATAANELGIVLVGGHSEITIGLDRPILVGQMIGEADREHLLDLRRAQEGDAVILCSGIALEGTAILAATPATALDSLSPSIVQSAVSLLESPGISVIPAAQALQRNQIPVRGLHDPTEGGIATALWELAAATGLGIEVDLDSIPVLPETTAICEALGLDPLGLIASGALLAVVPAENADRAVEAVEQAGIPAARIATMLAPGQSLVALRGGIPSPMPTFEVDEIARFFAQVGDVT